MKDFKYIDIIDLPSDPSGSLGRFRTTLLKTYNYNRHSEAKLTLLAKTMARVVQEITAGIETFDRADVEGFRKYQVDKEIKSTSTTRGFEPIKAKPQRAAKRTTTKRA